MSANLTDLLQTAVDALAAFNTELERQQREWAMSRYGKNFAGNGVELRDDLHQALLTEIVRFDDEAAGTLEQIEFEASWQREPERELA